MNQENVEKILNSIASDIHEFKKETIENFKSMEGRFDNVDTKLDELKSSANTFDRMLEKFPMERISRLEKHAKLSHFVPTSAEE